MDPYVCLGFVVLLVPIALLVIGAVELHKLKKTVRQLGCRVGELESGKGGVEVMPRYDSHRRLVRLSALSGPESREERARFSTPDVEALAAASDHTLISLS